MSQDFRQPTKFEFGHLPPMIVARELGGGADRRSLAGPLPGEAAMLHVPARFATILVAFAPVFVQARTFQHAQMLLLALLWHFRSVLPNPPVAVEATIR